MNCELLSIPPPFVSFIIPFNVAVTAAQLRVVTVAGEAELAPIVVASIVPPLISAVVIIPRSATVLPALVQLAAIEAIVAAPPSVNP